MKKIVTFLFAAIIISSAMGQEKGLFISLGGNYGANNFKYTLDNGAKSKMPLGWGAGLKVQYFWHKHWGFSFGAEWFDYNGKASYTRNWKNPYLDDNDPLGGDRLNGDPTHFITNGMYAGWAAPILPPGKALDYQLRLSLDNWVEKQHGYIVNVPLMFEYQTKWGKKEQVGMYFALGAKLQIPVLQKTYEHVDGVLRVVAYFPSSNLSIPENYNTEYMHGLGTTKEHPGTLFEGDFKLKTINVAAAGEIGFLFAFSPRVNLSVGIYADYGLLNMKKGNSHESGKLIMPETNENGVVNPAALDNAKNIGDGLRYNSFMQSHVTDRVDLLAFGVKVGLRIKLGKLRDRIEEDEACGPLDKCFIEKLYAADAARRDAKQQELIDSIKAAIGAPRSIEYTQVGGQQIGGYYPADFQRVLDSLMNAINGPRHYIERDKLKDGTKLTINCIEGDTLWDPRSPSSPNNPESEKYPYPYWYDPDYITDPSLINDIGLAGYSEGPNNPASIARNNSIVVELEKYIVEPIYFDLDKSTLKPESITKIEKVVEIMKKYPRLVVSLLGHTCDIASNDYNEQLSARRAKAVSDYMVKKGIKINRIGLLPIGKINPTYPNDTEANRAKNRRVDFILTK